MDANRLLYTIILSAHNIHMDAKDSSTREHSERVAELAVAIGTALGWEGEALVRLREAGLVIDSAAPWTDHVVVDGNLVTGQNPQSSASVARRVIEALG